MSLKAGITLPGPPPPPLPPGASTPPVEKKQKNSLRLRNLSAWAQLSNERSVVSPWVSPPDPHQPLTWHCCPQPQPFPPTSKLPRPRTPCQGSGYVNITGCAAPSLRAGLCLNESSRSQSSKQDSSPRSTVLQASPYKTDSSIHPSRNNPSHFVLRNPEGRTLYVAYPEI